MFTQSTRPPAPSSILSAKAIGATGDGTTDDSEAITAGIAAAVAAGKDLYLPPGTYRLSSSVAIDGEGVALIGNQASLVYDSETRIGVTISAASRGVTITGVEFATTSTSDAFAVNAFGAVMMTSGASDVFIDMCAFDHCPPGGANDSLTSRGLRFTRNYVYRPTNGLALPSHSFVQHNHFIHEAITDARAQFVYCYGQSVDIEIASNYFKNGAHEDIQIRAGNPRFDQRQGFRIVNNHFQNSAQYSIWFGSDDHPAINGASIQGNTFRNCVAAINVRGDALIAGNKFEYDWEWPHALTGTGASITVSPGAGIAGQYNQSVTPTIRGNDFHVRQPWFRKITVGTIGTPEVLPVAGDTITVGSFTYTWRAAASVEGDIQIGADLRLSAENLAQTIRGVDGRMTAPNDAIRWASDVFNNQYGESHGETNYNVVYVASGAATAFALSETGSSCAIVAPIDLRQVCANSISVESCISPVISDNTSTNVQQGIKVVGNYHPRMSNNRVIDCGYGISPLYYSYGNIRPKYSGNDLVQLDPSAVGRPYNTTIADAFPDISDDFVLTQQLVQNSANLGRSGVQPIGNMKAHTLLWYGYEPIGMTKGIAPTRPYTWFDGDQINLYNGEGFASNLFTFKRTSPGAGEFNSAATLMVLIDAASSGRWVSSLTDINNDLGATDPSLMIKIEHSAGGTAGNNDVLILRRYIKPGDTTTYLTVPQPLMTGAFLRNPTAPDDRAKLYGGVATRTKTFVHTPIACKSKMVNVGGFDSTSHALAPVVYQADIIPGVGFHITHSAGAGSEKFFWSIA